MNISRCGRMALVLAAGVALCAPLSVSAADVTVVASVGGEPITKDDLNRERATLAGRPGGESALDQLALQQIITRRLVSRRMRREAAEKGPEAQDQLRRAQETAAAQLFQKQIAESVSAPAAAEVQKLVDSRPEMFANRRVLFVAQISARPANPDRRRFEPLHSLEDIKAFLTAEGTPFDEGATVIDSASADSALMQAIAQVPPGEVFMLNQSAGTVFNLVVEARSVPLTGDRARAYASNLLRNQRVQEAVRAEIVKMFEEARSTLTFATGYQPKAP